MCEIGLPTCIVCKRIASRKSQTFISPSKEAVSSWNGFSGFRIAAVIISECPSPVATRDTELPDEDEDKVDTTLPDATE